MVLQFEESKQLKKLSQLRAREEEESARQTAEKLGLPYLDLSAIPITTEALKLIPFETARRLGMAAIQRVGSKVQVALKNPHNPQVQAELKRLENERTEPQLFLVSSRSLEKAFKMYDEIPKDLSGIIGQIDVSAARLESFRTEIVSLEMLRQKIGDMGHSTISSLLEVIIGGALATEASDVHCEPQESGVRIRYRLDGILMDIADISKETYKFLLGRIKLISELTLNIREKAQDGRFTIKTPDGEIEVRVSTLPGPYGENLVMRILNPTAIGLSLSDLGLQPWMEKQIEAELKKPNGMIITTGPTGSGKTTSLYAFLKKVHQPGVKIITLEDPIEYHLPGVEQTQVEAQKGYDFASGLRAILRQDPDVILVGEIRDRETAETAMHASLTGHLVFSTLHTNNAAGTIPRLIDMEVKPNIIAPAINVAMAQRLVRRLCNDCKKVEPATAAELAVIKKDLETLPTNIEKQNMAELKIAHPAGCQECHGTGYKGRIGVYELILIDDEMERLIAKQPSEADVKAAASEQGQITMRQDGILKVIAGVTDLAELERVVG
ncbi:MAG: type II/IV secretion system protein [Candidatus Sungbacteria bacterium]|uniref:Type II/IV secretion system protein n=1 Tax=Candidatus Sungiibacteriota bacterium TaxID=2750080 RepID=A0A9D6QVF4_9BACT|nr:type II/IV secretion system protein [Candidatus Sungbacteria bacterium]